jgi:hypothetical protein
MNVSQSARIRGLLPTVVSITSTVAANTSGGAGPVAECCGPCAENGPKHTRSGLDSSPHYSALVIAGRIIFGVFRTERPTPGVNPGPGGLASDRSALRRCGRLCSKIASASSSDPYGCLNSGFAYQGRVEEDDKVYHAHGRD